jgi:hypothetical protein
LLVATAAPDPARIDLLLQYAVAAAALEDDPRDRELGPIHLIKYIYLGDLAFAKRHDGKTFTGVEWQFWHFGPWSAAIFERIEPSLSAIDVHRREVTSPKSGDEFVRFYLTERADELREKLEAELPIGITAAIRSAIHEFGSDTASLLRHVYTTAPILRAAPGETLVLTREAGDSVGRPATLDRPHATRAEARARKAALAELRARVRARLDQRRSERPPVSAHPMPRYDEVFAQGAAWLEENSRRPVEAVEGEIIVSDGVWKSETRADPDVP